MASEYGKLVSEWISSDSREGLSIQSHIWTCEDTVRLALPALYELDLPQTNSRTEALAKVLEDRHFSEVTGGHSLTWIEWVAKVQDSGENPAAVSARRSVMSGQSFLDMFSRLLGSTCASCQGAFAHESLYVSPAWATRGDNWTR
jgi:hypothetical protein